MIIRYHNRIFTNTPEASPQWECFRPAKECEHGGDVVTFKGIAGRWKFVESLTPLEIMGMVLTVCNDEYTAKLHPRY